MNSARSMLSFANVSPQEIAALPVGTRIVDVREPDEWWGHLGHLPNAHLVPLATVRAQAVNWDRHAPVLLVCRSGGRSSQAASWMASAGFTQVFNLEGGMMACNAAGLPVVRA